MESNEHMIAWIGAPLGALLPRATISPRRHSPMTVLHVDTCYPSPSETTINGGSGRAGFDHRSRTLAVMQSRIT